MYETMLAILHKVALTTHTYLPCVSVSQYLNVEPIGPDTTLLYLIPRSYYKNGYMGVCKMQRCGGVPLCSGFQLRGSVHMLSFLSSKWSLWLDCSSSNFHSLRSEHIV